MEKETKKTRKVWATTKDVEAAVDLVKKLYEETGAVPEPLRDAMMRSLRTSRHGLIQRFYAGLADRCPEAIRWFMEKSTEGGNSECLR